MKKQSLFRRPRNLRQFVLTASIAPAIFGLSARAVDENWTGSPVSLEINPLYQAGLREGSLAGAFNTTDANPGTAVTLLPRLGEDNGKPPWSDNQTWVYTGEILVGPSGTISFAEAVDDNVLLTIDGVTYLNNTAWDVNSASGVLNFAPNTYHTFEVRFGNGGGGAGPVPGNGWSATYGFGMSTTGATSTNGADYFIPTDPGDKSLFQYLDNDGINRSDVHVQANTVVTLSLVGNHTINAYDKNSISFEPVGATQTLAINKANPSDPLTLRTLSTAIPASKTITITGNGNFTPGTVTAGTGSRLIKDGTGLMLLDKVSGSSMAGLTLQVLDGTVSVVGNGNNPLSTMTARVEIGQSVPAVGAVPILRVGSVAGTTTSFVNRLDVKSDGTVQHLSSSFDTLAGSTVKIANGKTLTTDVTNGQLNISSLILGTGASIRKTGSNTLVLSGAQTTVDTINVVTGRVQVNGILSMLNAPTVANGATLALTNSSGDNSLPSVIAIPSGTLEGVPGAFGDAATALNLTGGTLRLAAIGDGLNARIYNQSAPNVNNGVPAFTSGFADYNNFFAGLPAPNVTVLTTAGGVAALDFQGSPQFGAYGVTFDDNMISRMSGKILIPDNGSYTFGTSSDDGSVVYIDGQLVVNNNFYQGRTRRTGAITLTAGLHDIEVGFFEGGGGNSLTVDYAGPGIAQTNLPNSVLFSGNTVSTFNNPIDVQQNSTIDVQLGTAIVSSLTMQPGRKITATGAGILSVPTVTLNGAGAYEFSGNGTIIASVLNDGGADVDITKSGSGVLVLDNTTTAQLQNPGSTITINSGAIGLLFSSAPGASNPLGNAGIVYAGGGLVLSSKDPGATISFNLPAFSGNGSVIARQVGSGVNGPVTFNLQGSLGVAGGQTVTLGTANGYLINVGGNATGTGKVVVTGAGVTTVTNGALQGLNLDIGDGFAGSLRANHNAPTYGSLSSGSASTSLIVGDGVSPAILTLGGGTNGRFNGVISEQPGSTVSLIKTGSNTQTLGGLNTFTGGITMLGGTLEIKQSSIGANTINLSAGTLQFAGSGLLGSFYSGDNGGANANFGGNFAQYDAYLNARTPNTIATTSTGGITQLSYDPTGGDTQMFAAYGFNANNDLVSRMAGKIVAPAAGTYTFGTTSDDGSVIFIDGVKVVANSFFQGMTRRTGTIELTAGTHTIDIGYYEGGGGNGLVVDWAGPGFGSQTIQNTSLENRNYIGTDNVINMTGSATIDARQGDIKLGALVQVAGTTLTTTAGRVSFTEALMSNGTYNYDGAGDVVFKQITDGGQLLTINRSGGGDLVLGRNANPQLLTVGDVINVSGGSSVIAIGDFLPGPAETINPLGTSVVNIANGSGLKLSSVAGGQLVNFNNTVNLAGSARIVAGNFGADAVNGPAEVALISPVTVSAGNTLTVNSANSYTLSFGNGAGNGGVSGAGNVSMTGGTVQMKENLALSGAGQLTVSGGTLSALKDVVASVVSVSNGTLATSQSLTAGQVTVSGGVLDASGPVAASVGYTGSGGAFKMNGVTYSGGPVSLSGGRIEAATGINDFGSHIITVAPVVANTVPNALLSRVYSGYVSGAGPVGSESGIAALLATIATAQRNLTQDLIFTNDAAFNTFFGVSLADRFVATWTGKLNAPVSGQLTLGESIYDDNAAIWVDLNQNGIFENTGSSGNELIVSNNCCGGTDAENTTNGTVSLVGGQSYKVAIVIEDTGGGSGYAARLAQGAVAGPGGLAGFVNPIEATQAGAGLWSFDAPAGGGLIQVNGSSELRTAGVVNGQTLLLNGSDAKLSLTTATASTASVLTTAGAAGTSEVAIQSGGTLTVGNLVIAPGTTMLKSGAGELDAAISSIGLNGILEVGGGKVVLTGQQGAFTGPQNFGGVDVDSTGSLYIAGSMTFASMNIDDGGLVVLGSAAPPAPFLAEGAHAVPEPGSLSLIFAGVLGILGSRAKMKR